MAVRCGVWLSGVLATAAGVVPGAELVVRDMGLGLRYLTGSYEFTIDDPTGVRDGSETLDTGYAAYLDARYGFTGAGDRHGFLIGAEVAYALRGSDAVDFTTYGGSVLGGYGYAITDRWNCFLTARGSYGLGMVEVDGGGRFAAVEGDGDWWGYGAQLGVAYAVTDHLLIDVQGGYQQRFATWDLDGFATDLELAGLAASVGLTWRLSIAPTPLE